MDAAAKIRWLLGLICLSLFLTAIIVKQTYSPENNLESSAKTLEDHLHEKETRVHRFLDDKAEFFKLKNADNDEQYALKLVAIAHEEKIYIATYQKDSLIFWSGVRVLPDKINNVKNGSSFIQDANGYYEEIRKTEGAFSVVFFIPVKNQYSYQNTYLQNVFSPDLLQDDNIDIADFTDHNTYSIHTIDNHYLFTVKLKPNDWNHTFQYIQLMLWLSGLLLMCVLVNNLANYINRKGHILMSFSVVGGFIAAVRFMGLYYHWPDIYSEIDLFKPGFYHLNWLFPNEGDFMINTILLTWLALYVYQSRDKIIGYVKSRSRSFIVCVACVVFLVIVSRLLLVLAQSQVLNSTINFDVNNVLNLSALSVVGIIALCLFFFSFVLLTETCIAIGSKLNISHRNKFYVLMAVVLLATIPDVLQKDYSCFYLLWSLIIIIRGWSVFYGNGKFTPVVYIGIIIVCSTLSSIKLYNFENIKEKETRKQLVKQLETDDDPDAEALFKEVEDRVLKDNSLVEFFKNPSGSTVYLQNRFKKLYFNGYLTKFDLSTYEYNLHDEPLSGNNTDPLNEFKYMVEMSGTKVIPTRYFYKDNNSFGSREYFAIVPITSKGEQIGTVVFYLKSKSTKNEELFPELLVEGNADNADNLKEYSYAYYLDGKLINQNGKYVYSLVNSEFEGKPGQYIYKNTSDNVANNSDTGYSHLIYQPGERKIIVVSKEDDKLFTGLTSLTFFFLVFAIFNLLVLGVGQLWENIRHFKRPKWGFWYNFDKVLYQTRIQLSMVFAVVITLIIIGVLTFFSVRAQYINQQDDEIRDKITRIALAFEKAGFDKTLNDNDENTLLAFNSFADTYSSDLTLFNIDGKEILTTQPKLYEAGLIEPRMNAKAFIYLARLKKSGFINPELIGLLDYKSAYAPVRNSKKEVTGFLQLPYFSNQNQYKEHIGAFLNTMINVYALVFVAIGLFAIAVARQITTPLTIIQQSLSKTIYGRKNEPIEWHHNDEIGSLIKEYNNMIAALEDSASKLAQSEREHAWREMAKQVAHEIKNPLTPLKLGLQLLEKAWKDKDPRFDQKFERFSKSFVEQIDSLSRIASEFSNFAKMPETHIERIDIFELLTQAVTIFKQADGLEIVYTQPTRALYIMADRDQILRCFNNLLKNATEAIPAERAGIIEITYTVKPGEVFIQIKDNGNGIPEALRERIFVPNFTTKSSGTGLGLALVKNAITYAGGTISFDTEIGKGTTFYISFPEVSQPTGHNLH